MSQGRPAQQTASARTEGLGLVTGSLKDDFTRVAQERSDCGGISCNLTEKGVWLHDIEQGTELNVLVFDEGIWITPRGDS